VPADYQLWIDGAPTDADSGETFDTLDPSTGRAHAAVAGPERSTSPSPGAAPRSRTVEVGAEHVGLGP
jgi:hypothetical protein